MNKRIKILIVGLVLLIGSNVEAQSGFSAFSNRVQNNSVETIYLIDFTNPLYWTSSAYNDGLHVRQNKTFIGLEGEDFAILNGTYYGFISYSGFLIYSNNIQINFRYNFRFENFITTESDGISVFGIEYYYQGGSLNFTDSKVDFINNVSRTYSNGYGGVISISRGLSLYFRSSTVNFISNRCDNWGGAISAYNGPANIYFISSVVNFTSNTATYGGAISASQTQANISFISSVVNFTSNTANLYGGAISANNGVTVNFTNSAVNFTSNSAGSFGGAIYAYNNRSNINFTNSAVNFTSNTAKGSSEPGGGAIYAYNSIFNFTNSTVSFTGNTAGWSGGAIHAEWSSINFTNSTVSFTGNTAGWSGGAIHADRSTFNFTNSAVNFTGNTVNDFWGAIFSQNSIFNFTNSTVNFTGNTAGWSGGAILAGGNINFTSSIVNFISNTAVRGYGGAISGSNINFTSSVVNFTSNTAGQNGGAIYAYSYFAGPTTINFTSSVVNFTSNTAGQNGGAIYAFDDSAYPMNINFMNSNVNFTSNIARLDGGVIYAYARSAGPTTINFTSSVVNFTSNTAGQNGGAIFSSASFVNFTNSNVSFTSNTAGQKGGAIYAFGSSVAFAFGAGYVTSAGGWDISFAENKAGGKSNDIYMERSQLWGSGKIWMAGGVEAVASTVVYRGGVWKLGGLSDFQNMGRFELQGMRMEMAGGTFTYRSGGSALVIMNSTVSFLASSISFVGNTARALRVLNSSVAFGGNVSFRGNTLEGRANDILLENSRLWMSGSVRMDGGMEGVGSTVSFRNGIWNLGGLNDFKGMKLFEVSAASLTIVNSTFSFINSVSALSLSHSTLTFVGSFSSITFRGNGVSDISLSNSIVNIDSVGGGGRIIFNNGLRTSGGSTVKRGLGKVFFDGAGTRLGNFTISAGTAIFHAAKSTVSALTIAAGAGLDLSGGSTSTLFISNNFTLNGFLGLDFDFANSSADFVRVGGNVTIDVSTLMANIVAPATVCGSSLAFMSAGNLAAAAWGNLNLLLTDYMISRSNNMLWLVYGDDDPWNAFVFQYRNRGDDNVLSLGQSIFARNAEAFSFGTGAIMGRQNLTVDGGYFVINSSGQADKGFVIEGSSISFMNIVFTSFSRTNAMAEGNGGVMAVYGSTVIFRGSTTWVMNAALSSGGAVFAASSFVRFEGSLVNFTSNAAASGGAIYAEGSNVSFINSTVSFMGNRSGGREARFIWIPQQFLSSMGKLLLLVIAARRRYGREQVG